MYTEGNLTGAFKQLYKLTNEHMNPGDHYPVDNENGPGDQDNLANAQDQPPQPRALDAELAAINGDNELAEDPIQDSDGDNVVAERPAQRRRLNDN